VEAFWEARSHLLPSSPKCSASKLFPPPLHALPDLPAFPITVYGLLYPTYSSPNLASSIFIRSSEVSSVCNPVVFDVVGAAVVD
jgi:hypothetical protein